MFIEFKYSLLIFVLILKYLFYNDNNIMHIIIFNFNISFFCAFNNKFILYNINNNNIIIIKFKNNVFFLFFELSSFFNSIFSIFYKKQIFLLILNYSLFILFKSNF